MSYQDKTEKCNTVKGAKDKHYTGKLCFSSSSELLTPENRSNEILKVTL